MTKLLFQVWKHLKKKRKYQLLYLVGLNIFTALAELLSIGSIVPFLGVLIHSSSESKPTYAASFLYAIGLENQQQQNTFFVYIFIFLAVFVPVLRLLNLYLNTFLAARVGSDLSTKAFRLSLNQSYITHISRNSSILINTLVSQTNLAVMGFTAFLQMVTALFISSVIILGIFLANWKLAVLALTSISLLYLSISVFTRAKLHSNSHLVARSSSSRIQVIQESLGSIRDVILDNSSDFYCKAYDQNDNNQRILQAQNEFIAGFPRFALEATAMIIIGVFCLNYFNSSANVNSLVPILGLVAFASQRLLPAAQLVYGSWASLCGFKTPINDLVALLNQPCIPVKRIKGTLEFESSIELQGVKLSYPNNSKPVFKELNLMLPKGSKTVIVGPSGSGKSSLMDIIMGLLEPSGGKIMIDSKSIHDPSNPHYLHLWRNTIAHVPQTIYLADCSIAKNIAFGIPYSKIDKNRLIDAAKKANIHHYINSLPDKYDSRVGERGLQLSGGQRQRIGIARALYRDASVLLLDEFTSALDANTEKSIMETIQNLDRSTTIIVITHRPVTAEAFDQVYRLDSQTIQKEH